MNAGLGPIFLFLVISVTAVQSLITKGPVNALKNVGDSVMLKCVTSSKDCDMVEWKKLEGAQSARIVYTSGIILNGFPGERYSVNSTEGCNLIISELEVNDSGRFSCVLLEGDMEYTRSSILVVISVTESESCRSNVSNNALNQNDRYSFSAAINVPAKSVEPSNVTLYFLNKTADETETMDNSQPLIVKTTLTGIARKEKITQRLWRAYLHPNAVDGFKDSTATLDGCSTPQLNVSYPVENVTVLPNNGKFYEGDTISCTAYGYPMPTFLWKNLTSGLVVQNGSSLNITKDSFGYNFSCIASNTVNGKKTSMEKSVFVPKSSVDLPRVLQSNEVGDQTVHSQILKGPANALKKVGDSVTLECVTSSKNCDNVDWSKMEGAQTARKVYTNGIILNGFPGERYSVSRTGGCSLTIIQLEISDSGQFICVMTADDREYTRSSILVVIGVTESCLSNVTSNALNQNDGYSFWTAINMPPKSVEQSNVTLYFLNKTADETETMANSQPLIVKTTLIGIVRHEHMTQRVCRASFHPNRAGVSDRSTAILDVCTTQQLIVAPVAVHSQILKGPVNALKKVGDSVTLECVTSSKSCDNVEWKKMEGHQTARTVYTRGIILNGFPGERYSVNSTGGCNLTIIRLKISDSGRFSCVLLVDDREEIKGSILVVIDVREACRSNVMSNALNQNDSYSFRASINVPPKSVEPSNVTLSFQNITASEREEIDDNQSQTVNATFTGTARKENITQRVCRASLPPNTADDFYNSSAILYVCTTPQLIVSYPVENVSVWPNDGKLHEGNTINCTADGYPMPNFLWINLTSGLVVQNDSSISIAEDSFGHNFSCIATNTVNGKKESKQMIVMVSKPSESVITTTKPSDRSDTGGSSSRYIAGTTSPITAVVIAQRVDTTSVRKKTEQGEHQRLEQTTSSREETTKSRPISSTATEAFKSSEKQGEQQRPEQTTSSREEATKIRPISSTATETFKSSEKQGKQQRPQQTTSPREEVTKIRRVSSTATETLKSSEKQGEQQRPEQTTSPRKETTKSRPISSTATETFKSSETVQSVILRGPVNALKKVADAVTLECVTRSGNCDQVEWKKMEGAQSSKYVYQNGIGMLNTDAFPRERYSVNSAGGCSLTITQLKISDSGIFRCVLLVRDKQVARSSILVVVSVSESEFCRSNVTRNVLNQNDGYSFSAAISVPAKYVEPSSVFLSFQNMTVDETETMDNSQPLTVKTTLTGIAGKENITQRVCRASLAPTTQADFDRSTATLDVCTTQQVIVSSMSIINKQEAPMEKSEIDSAAVIAPSISENSGSSGGCSSGCIAGITVSAVAVVCIAVVVGIIVMKKTERQQRLERFPSAEEAAK